jgi:menaquinone-dependent protoporphyrinogen IX oxidase
MKTLILYYSKTGNNSFLGKRCAGVLNADMEQIRPRLNMLPFQILFSLMKRSPGIRKLTHDITSYERIILCDPIWMGQPASALRVFLQRFNEKINKLAFITCCGGGDETKDEKFGYRSTFKEIEQSSGGKTVSCEAFPVILALPEEKRKDSDAVMKTRLNDGNFTGMLKDRFETWVETL